MNLVLLESLHPILVLTFFLFSSFTHSLSLSLSLSISFFLSLSFSLSISILLFYFHGRTIWFFWFFMIDSQNRTTLDGQWHFWQSPDIFFFSNTPNKFEIPRMDVRFIRKLLIVFVETLHAFLQMITAWKYHGISKKCDTNVQRHWPTRLPETIKKCFFHHIKSIVLT